MSKEDIGGGDVDSEQSSHTLHERLRALAAFAPQFEEPGFRFGEWVEQPSEEPCVVPMQYYVLSPQGDAFFDMAYEMGWVRMDFDWIPWLKTPEGIKLHDNPAAMAEATAEQLARVLTVPMKQERIAEGTLADAYDSGLLTAICRRAAILEVEMTNGGPQQ